MVDERTAIAGRARLFTALPLPGEAVDSLRAELARHPCGPGSRRLRWSRPQTWHVTLGFYGMDDPRERSAWLRERLAGIAAPVVRLEASGSFRGVLWIGVRGDGLDELAAAVRPEDEERAFRGHLTLARGDAPAAIRAWARLLGSYRGPAWTAREVVLFRSDAGARGHVHTPVERFPLGRPVT
ncbi:RNA 2',3'-cyclic phosphodiesterase [Prauserella oleivorans]|uniref:RNA 2',3'-cyclic phosphodiesterase n=1 Tax=Prauserella oleivorans TaxID=1478153 RepID=A0ABW5W9K0_9PSEU